MTRFIVELCIWAISVVLAMIYGYCCGYDGGYLKGLKDGGKTNA
jgi:hypothetical protein